MTPAEEQLLRERCQRLQGQVDRLKEISRKAYRQGYGAGYERGRLAPPRRAWATPGEPHMARFENRLDATR